MTGNDQITEKSSELSPKQFLLITALLTPLNITAAAKAAGVADKTARRWLALPHFQAAYKAVRRALFDESLASLMSGVDCAIEGIKNIAGDSEVEPAVRLRAYSVWLTQAIAVYKTSELEAQFSELQALIKEQGIRV